METIEIIKAKLNADVRFCYHGRGANQGVWATKKKGDADDGDFIQLKKTLAGKGFGKFQIFLFKEDEQGMEMRIEMYVPSLCEWQIFFEGFVETEDDFDRLFVMLGLN